MRKWILWWLLGATALLAPADAFAVGAVHEHATGRDSLDRRGAVGPSVGQRAAAARLGARVSWNRFGTPRSLSRASGWLAEGLG